MNYWEIDLTTIFSEPDSEDLTFDMLNLGPSNPLSDWINVDNATDKLFGTPIHPTASYDHTLELRASDPKGLIVDFVLNFTVIKNEPPRLENFTTTTFD